MKEEKNRLADAIRAGVHGGLAADRAAERLCGTLSVEELAELLECLRASPDGDEYGDSALFLAGTLAAMGDEAVKRGMREILTEVSDRKMRSAIESILRRIGAGCRRNRTDRGKRTVLEFRPRRDK